MIELLTPLNGATIETLTPLQIEFIAKIRGEGIDQALEWLLPQKAEQEHTRPQKCVLEWAARPDETAYKVELAETEDFSACRIYQTNQTKIEVTNLKIGQTYFWRVNGGKANRFTTQNRGFRFIEIDGIPNVRDLGGGCIRQGLLYRGAELDWEYKITEQGKKTFAEELGIQTQLNLRQEMQSERTLSVVGNGVRFACLPYRPYNEVFLAEHRENICRIFDFLAQKEHYPIYFHCRGGADRTGMLALYLRALAGDSEEDIFMDYELTSLSNYHGGANEGVPVVFRNRNNEYFMAFLANLKEVTGQETLQNMVYVFLMDCGISEQTIQQVLQIIKA